MGNTAKNSLIRVNVNSNLSINLALSEPYVFTYVRHQFKSSEADANTTTVIIVLTSNRFLMTTAALVPAISKRRMNACACHILYHMPSNTAFDPHKHFEYQGS